MTSVPSSQRLVLCAFVLGVVSAATPGRSAEDRNVTPPTTSAVDELSRLLVRPPESYERLADGDLRRSNGRIGALATARDAAELHIEDQRTAFEEAFRKLGFVARYATEWANAHPPARVVQFDSDQHAREFALLGTDKPSRWPVEALPALVGGRLTTATGLKPTASDDARAVATFARGPLVFSIVTEFDDEAYVMSEARQLTQRQAAL